MAKEIQVQEMKNKRLFLVGELEERMKAVQIIFLNSSEEHNLILGSAKLNHGEILRRVLDSKQISYDSFHVADNVWYPERRKEGVYLSPGMGFAAPKLPALILVTDKSSTYELPICRNHAEAWSRISQIRLEII